VAEIIKALVDRNRQAIQQRLPKYLTPEQFFQLCYALDRNSKLAQVAQRNPDSVLNAVLKAADCGLLLGTVADHCWVIPYGDEAQLQIGWKGFVYQWIRAGAILSIDAQVVYLGDHIKVTGGDTPKIVHQIKMDDPKRDDPRWLYDSKNIVGAYAIAALPTGGKARKYCPRGEIEFARSRSPGANKSDSPWNHNYPAMARKTPIRRLSGIIQVCGPTPENQEAWERYSRTLEIDRGDFRVVEDDNVIDLNLEDDLPGARPTKKEAPPPPIEEHPSGARTDPVTRPTAKRGPESPLGPPPATPATDNPISMETQDDLIAQARMADIPTSQLLKLIREKYGTGDLGNLRDSQAAELANEFRQRLAGARG
jgi:phage RecT family recombinase